MTSDKPSAKDLEYIRLYRASYFAERCADKRAGLEKILMMKMIRSMVTFAKVSLFFLNLYVAAVVLVVVMGHWRIFESQDPTRKYDDSHLIVMRELKEEEVRKPANFTNEKLVFQSEKQTTLSPFDLERAERVSTMRHWCNQLKPKVKDSSTIAANKLQQIFVDDKHKLMYCQIPGVAETDFRRILIYLTGQVKVESPLKISGSDVFNKYAKHVKKLSEFSPQERKKRIDGYYKVMFVREPLERLVYSFKSKFESKNSKYFHQAFGRKIVKKYRSKPSKSSLEKGNDVKFDEFVQFVIDTDHADEMLNEHWQQYYKQCHPCLVEYDYVGKFETLNEDISHVLRKTKADKEIKGPLVVNNYKYPEKVLKPLFKSVSTKNLRRLWKIYYPDYNLFSYQYPYLLDEILHDSKVFYDY